MSDDSERFSRLSPQELKMDAPALLAVARAVVDSASWGEDIPVVWLSEALDRLGVLLGNEGGGG